MAKSRYEYVKLFEKDDTLLPNTWIVVRLDGRGFHGFSRAHAFMKPNDINALNLMNIAAKSVMKELSSDIVLAYGDSDEYSFLLSRGCELYNRREFKIVSAFVSLFTSYYMYYWKDYFPNTVMKYPPSFDGRAVLYPDIKNVRDYFAWRQVDCHINNLHNTTFWALVNQGMSEHDATKRLEGTEAADKNEILWAEFGKNYNKEPAMFRKGTVLYREALEVNKPEPSQNPTEDHCQDPLASDLFIADSSPDALPTMAGQFSGGDGKPADRTMSNTSKKTKAKKRPKKYVVKEEYIDIIKDAFWESKPWILS